MLSLKAFVTGYVLILLLISIFFYRDHGDPRKQNRRVKISSPWHFKWVYKGIWLSVVYSIVASLWLDFGRVGTELSSSAVVVGLALASLGILIFVAAKTRLGQHYSPCFDAYAPNDVIRTGLYQYIRHPIYVGNILALLGIGIATQSWVGLVATAVLTAYYIRSALLEEQVMVTVLPSYRLYQQSTHMFWPRLLKKAS